MTYLVIPDSGCKKQKTKKTNKIIKTVNSRRNTRIKRVNNLKQKIKYLKTNKKLSPFESKQNIRTTRRTTNYNTCCAYKQFLIREPKDKRGGSKSRTIINAVCCVA